ncbi:retinoic acid receptor responder protein 2-like isoform 2-T2 [Anomaloglossus baeobatrachus]|uniref:retinoic acid receptor responder protein 2-like isoform X2 n=1 Tax=Anomaloglossus baeobatrachus TaxID=238106 RepID=UPI003F4FDBA8
MKTAAITWGIISVLLIVNSEGQSTTDNFSENQNKATKLIMEHFHTKDHIRNGFKVSNVIKAIEIDYISGVFVNLELELKQTTCQKSHWTKTDCGLTRNGRTFNCFACFKFSYHSHKILSQLMDCVAAHQVDARVKRRNQSCTEVELKEGYDKPGSYGFLKSN